ncbi:probable protein phosphatase 2C 75 [Ricinus communis]|uniref:protein-serine/threonine phosphatase n=1 Tax=Ricinus communis TaxID=3988 RepID=B9R9K8_RICCO|nr:probable protein phosphatase 2C 75 [Ricinus communis]EEF51485.1 protein phosphatase 2c, putative [Ricinus communis]|eukprot:XP_002510883.1 probable protein phosphatase 2C 75 [Ricinus communis]
MTDVCRRMLSDDDDDSPAKCRERRRRRIEMRRLSSLPVSGTPSPASKSQVESSNSVANEKQIKIVDGVENEPTFGTMSVAGRSSDMEDAVAVRISLCKPDINNRRPVHYFAVYDGHGGSHVAALCRERMHVVLEGELMRTDHTDNGESGEGRGKSSSPKEREFREGKYGWEEQWKSVLIRSFKKMDEAALSTCACGSIGFDCGCHPMEVALGGSTAVVAILTPEHIIVANCGDSRAVLCRGGRAIPLSVDHKPDRSDEFARIKAAGGRVIFVNGARVEGILAMSRAIGDKYLKPVVTSEPEITFTRREPDDECLILASDGLWDVLSSDLACEVASECLREGSPTVANARPNMEDEEGGALYPSRSILAAAILTRLALGRRSADNISVIVVDLKRELMP